MPRRAAAVRLCSSSLLLLRLGADGKLTYWSQKRGPLLLYTRQDSWKGGHGAGQIDTPAVLRQLAGLAGATPAQIDRCLADDGLARAIAQEAQDGAQRFNIRSTPTFIVGDRAYPGLQTIPDFERLLTPLLRG